MLNGKLFTIKEKQEMTDSCLYRLALNISHPVYEAHFAGNPVTPGACIVQIIKELSEEYLNSALRIEAVKNTKFIHVIHPAVNHEITVDINLKTVKDDSVSFSATVFDGETTFAKATMTCVRNRNNPV
jgi:3-hydroxyacyl-[acyl-carrier-protein] dehydratase